MAATAGAFSLVTAKPGRTETARSMNSRTDAYWLSAIGSMIRVSPPRLSRSSPDIWLGSGGAGSPGTGYSCSPETWRTARLVTTALISGAARSSSATVGAAEMTCSKLSRTSSRRLSRSQSPSDFGDRPGARLGHAKCRRDAWRDEHRVADRFERHEEDPVGEVVDRSGGQLLRQPGLARPARTGQRQQPGRGEQPGHLVELRVAPDERRQLDRQVVRPGVERSERRERRRQPVRLDLEDPDRRGQVLEPVLARDRPGGCPRADRRPAGPGSGRMPGPVHRGRSPRSAPPG